MARQRILLAEDEPVSRRFLLDGLHALGYAPEAACDGDEAFALARAQRFDLLLLDLQLPARRGDAVLAALRGDAGAASCRTPAVAATADTDPSLARRLRGVGFAAVVHKPVALDALAATLAAVLASPAPRWDDAAALSAAAGDPAIVAALRTLLLQELPQQRRALLAARDRGDRSGARHELHRLRAACGFCGAAALGARAGALDAALAQAGREASYAEVLEEIDAVLDAAGAATD
jgi:two-component system, OmpR family, response regulator